VKPYYSDSAVTLYHGDCREVTAWLEADVLVTDPPYGRGWRQGVVTKTGSPFAQARNEVSEIGIANDSDTSARDEILSLWGDRKAIVFGDLMLDNPDRTKLVCAYHKADAAAGLRGAMGGVRRDLEAIYLVGPWPSGIGGRSSVFASVRQITGSQGIVAKNGAHPHTKGT
jgi:site-specific DNA-methyltransferase (adenine-specific)